MRVVRFLFANKKRVLQFSGISLFAGLFFIALLFIYYSKDLPSPDNIGELYIPESTKIFDRTGEVVLYDIYQEQKRTVVGYEDIPEHVRAATLVAEDDNFYHHLGVDFRAVFRALWENIKGQRISQGGSTITQQFVKNALLSPERTLSRKMKELILSFELEWKYSKDEILTLYLNQVPYGSNAYGIEAAARTYFNKHARELTIAESAMLSALPKAPTYYSPYGNNVEELSIRQQYVLERMLLFGYVTEEEYKTAVEEEIAFQTDFTGIEAPHFVIYVREYLESKYGVSFVQQAGLRVITTLDMAMQNIAERTITERAEFNEKNFKATNAALVALDPNSGQILAMVGSRDYFDIENDGNVNVTIRPRQPGSSFKPFAYAKAFEKGYTPDSLLYDVFTEFNPDCSWLADEEKDPYGLDCYHPQNYDELFGGPLSFKEALAQSKNVPSVKVLYLAGLQETIELAQKMGINSLDDPSRYGLSLVLGGGEVTLLEETAAYGVFATAGKKNSPVGVLKIEDKDGNVIEEFKQHEETVLDAPIARQITTILSDNALRAPVFGEQNYLTITGLALAAKTGTTQEYRDAWTVGYTPSIAVGVWVGNNDNEKMVEAPGSSAAGPIWQRFIRDVYTEKVQESEKTKNSEFYFGLPALDDEVSFRAAITKTTGKNVLDGLEASLHSILHFVSRDDPLGNLPDNPQNNPQYTNWENAIQGWAVLNNLALPDNNFFGEGEEENENNNKTSPITITFVSPQKESFHTNDSFVLEVEVDSQNPIKTVRASLDGTALYSTVIEPNNIFSYSFTQDVLLEGLAQKNLHTIHVEVSAFNESSSETYSFRID